MGDVLQTRGISRARRPSIAEDRGYSLQRSNGTRVLHELPISNTPNLRASTDFTMRRSADKSFEPLSVLRKESQHLVLDPGIGSVSGSSE